MPIVNGDHRNAEFSKVLIVRITNWKNYKRIDWKFKTMWESTNGIDFCGVNRKILRKSSNWRLCFMVSQRKKNKYGQIQEKMVWSIQGTILLT
jgi:hypothetical protein